VAARHGLKVNVLHVADDDLLMPVAERRIVRPSQLAAAIAGMAASLQGRKAAILIGHYAQQHPDYAAIRAAAEALGRATGAAVGVLPDGANAVGAWLAEAVPGEGGLDARAMIESPRRGYLAAGFEAGLDMGPRAIEALAGCEFGVVLTAYRSATAERGHVMLPIAPFAETAGTFVNMEGRVQSFNAAVKPQGDARPAWKVLRMLGAMLEIPGFHADRVEQVREAIAADLQDWATRALGERGEAGDWKPRAVAGASLERIAEFPIYAVDPVVRRAPALQKTADARAARTARLNPKMFAALGLAAGGQVRVRQGGGEAVLVAVADAAVPEGCVRIARGIPETAQLGEGDVEMDAVRVEAVA